jgi:very-short-patch-repair endonuclease
MRRQPIIDRKVAGQHGVIARAQLLDAGWSASQIDREVGARRLHVIQRGVYAVGHSALTREGRWMAAVLACGPGAVLSHHSAAALWGLPVHDNGLTRVTAPTVHSRRGTDVHRAILARRDRTVRRGIPVTSVARALADLAHALDDERYHRVVKEAQFRYAIPLPRTQYGEKPRVDFIWLERRLIVEVDGWEAHRTRVAFQDDRTNTNLLQLAGNIVLRYTWDDIRVRHAYVAGQLHYAGNFSSTHSGPSSARR